MAKIKLVLLFWGLFLPVIFAKAQDNKKEKPCYEIKISKRADVSLSKIMASVYDNTRKPIPAFLNINGVMVSNSSEPQVDVTVMPGKYTIQCTFVGMTSCSIRKIKIRKGEVFTIVFNLKYTDATTID